MSDRLFYALSLLVIALFVASGMARTTSWRPRLRLAVRTQDDNDRLLNALRAQATEAES